MSERIIVKMDYNSVLKTRVKDGVKLFNYEFTGKVFASDGYHTFEELYDHRITLFIALCKSFFDVFGAKEEAGRYACWRSKVNGDGTKWDGYFVMGIGKEAEKQITYHLPLSRWEETDFAPTLKQAPEFDGHSSSDVLERLKQL